MANIILYLAFFTQGFILADAGLDLSTWQYWAITGTTVVASLASMEIIARRL